MNGSKSTWDPAEAAAQCSGQPPERPRDQLGHEDEPLALPCGLFNLSGEDPLGFGPGHGREIPLGRLPHGPFDPIGIVEPGEGSLTAGAELPLVDRVFRVALHLDDVGVAILREHAAPRGALAAGGGEP